MSTDNDQEQKQKNSFCWEGCSLHRAMTSLDLHRRMVSLGLDGSLFWGGGTQTGDIPFAKFKQEGDVSSTDDENDDDLLDPYNREEYFNHFQRAVLWRIYLRVLPFPFNATSMDNLTEDWCATLFKQRAWYTSVRQAFLERYPEVATAIVLDEPEKQKPTPTNQTEHVDPTVEKDDENGDARRRASSVGENTPQGWRRMYRRSRKIATGHDNSDVPQESPIGKISDDIIALDIRRSYLVNDPHVPHDALFRILAVWRYLNPLIGYHQGMHEVAGNCLSLLLRASTAVPEGTPLPVAECCNPIYAEADAFVLFDTIMIHFGLGELFVPSHALHQRRNMRSSPENVSSTKKGKDLERPEFGDLNADRPTTKLEVVCEYIVEGLLKNHSTALYHHLANTGTLEQCLLFLPRWVRNLFTREVSVVQVFALWDGIFAIYYYELMQKVMVQLERKQRKQQRGSSQIGKTVTVVSPRRSQSESEGSNGLFGRLFRRSTEGKESEDSRKKEPEFPSSAEPDAGEETGVTVPETPLTVLGTSPVGNVTYAGDQHQSTSTKKKSKTGKAKEPQASALSSKPTEALAVVNEIASQQPGCFSRTVAGIALVILMYIEDDLLNSNDDFQILKCLTKTPLIPSTADPIILLSKAMTLARTRPAGIVSFSMRRSMTIDQRLLSAASGNFGCEDSDGEDEFAARRSMNKSGPVYPLLPPLGSGVGTRGSNMVSRSGTGAISREELLLQHESIAIVLKSVCTRIERLMSDGKKNAETSPASVPSGSTSGGGGGKITQLFRRTPQAVPQEPAAAVFSSEQLDILHSTVEELGHLSAKLQ